MAKPISATLHMMPEAAQAYRMLYTIVYNGGAAIPSKLHGTEQLTAFLTQLQLPATAIATILTRVRAGRS